MFSITVNLSLLVFFKYSNFLISNINSLTGLNIPFSNFNLPIGISFYTFQTISYVVDVFRGEVEAQKSPFKLLLFVSLFHQLVAGPIVRYKSIANEIENRIITMSMFSEGINRFVIGLAKKVILANPAGEISDIFLKGNLSDISTFGAWFGISLFALQIYFDFSGYSDMAIGLGKMFGFNYCENFNHPYLSKSATEFWRRWHISLGSFFRDYVYIPLGGNRKSPIRNLIIVWFFTGLWHGASWNFIIWGLYFGALIILEKTFLLNVFKKLPGFLSHIYFIAIVLIGWVFFYYIDFAKSFELLRVMFGFGNKGLTDMVFTLNFQNNIFFFIIAIIACMPIGKWMSNLLNHLEQRSLRIPSFCNSVLVPVMNSCLLFVSYTLLVGRTYNPFLYFRF
ncbi:MAG: MBOAT family O-acyltransferase [Ignavibacteriales bacterium]